MAQRPGSDNPDIDRYLRDEMGDEERAAFEEAFLGSPGLLDELEAAERLRQGLTDLAALDRARTPARRMPWYAMAASVAFLVSLGINGVLLTGRDWQPGRELEWSASPAVVVPLVTTRGPAGSTSVNTLELGPEARQFVLMLDPGFETFAQYRASVHRRDADTPILEVEGLRPTYESMLAISLPAAALKPGEYEIQLEGRRDEAPDGPGYEPVETYLFVVKPHPGGSGGAD